MQQAGGSGLGVMFNHRVRVSCNESPVSATVPANTHNCIASAMPYA